MDLRLTEADSYISDCGWQRDISRKYRTNRDKDLYTFDLNSLRLIYTPSWRRIPAYKMEGFRQIRSSRSIQLDYYILGTDCLDRKVTANKVVYKQVLCGT